MKQQVVVIHGGEAYSKYEDFVSQLKTGEVDYDNFFTERLPRWKDLIRNTLGDAYEVAKPRMPNSQNAKFDEWKIWFERLIPFLDDDVILVGHSQGATFLLKYLSENIFTKDIKKLFFIALALRSDGLTGEDGGDFLPDIKKVSSISKQCAQIFIFHSRDDEVCPFTHSQEVSKVIPSAEFVIFEDRDHFSQDEFPELIERIKK